MQRDELMQQMLELLGEIIEENRLDDAQEMAFDLDQDTPLFGGGAVISSLTLVSFITDMEALLDENWGVRMIIVDERALSRRNSPFLTVGTLADYVLEKVADGAAAAN